MENPNFHHPPVSKVPGNTTIKNQYILGDLTKLSRRELLDLESRQLKLLKNKAWLNKLPDKGKKIQDLYERVVKELEYKNEVHNAANLLSSLSLGSNNLNNLEWEGTTQPQKKTQVDSDDDEAADPLEILVSSNTVFSNKKIVKVKNDPNDKPLITEEDIKEAKEIENGVFHLDPVTEKICKMDQLDKTPFRFLPYKSTEQPCPIKNNSVSPKTKSSTVKQKGCEAIPLAESIVIEHKSQKARHELLEKHAAERLEAKKKELESAGLKLSEPPKIVPMMTKYRLPPEEYDEIPVKDDDDDLSDDYITDDEEGQ